MIRAHSRKVQEVRRLAVQTHMHKVLLRRRRDVLGRSLHGRLGTAGLLTSGVAAGFLAGLLLSPLRFLHGSGRAGLAALRLLPWFDTAFRAFRPEK